MYEEGKYVTIISKNGIVMAYLLHVYNAGHAYIVYITAMIIMILNSLFNGCCTPVCFTIFAISLFLIDKRVLSIVAV